MATIQLLLTDDANRRALASVVEDHHTVITDLELQPADVYLVDDSSLPEYQAALDAHKHEHAPVFCPVVLIRRDRTAVTVDLPDPGATERPLLVNEVVTAPVDEATVVRRVANLVARRRQTRELQEKTQRLEHFANTLRHEVRNPMNVLDGYLDLARERGDPEAFNRCQNAVDRMQRLFEETLVILQGGDPEIDQEPVAVAEASRESWAMVREPAAQLEVATTQRIMADRDRVTQLLSNLFRNAVEHGRSDVTVAVGECDSGFYVEDDGPGIPEEERDAVFEEGYSSREGGTGLGLAVVQAAAAAHDWDLTVTEGPMGGARFELTDVEIRDA